MSAFLRSSVVALPILWLPPLAGTVSASPTLTAPVQQAQAISQHLQQQRSQSGPPKASPTPAAKPTTVSTGGDLPAATDTGNAPKLRRAAKPQAR